MDEFNADPFFNTGCSSEQAKRFSSAQDLTNVPGYTASASIVPHQPIAAYADSYDHHGLFAPIDDFGFQRGGVLLPQQSTSSFDNIFDVSIEFRGAVNEHFTAPQPEDAYSIPQFRQLDNLFPILDMTDFVPEHHEDAQLNLQTLIDEEAPLRCTFLGCKQIQVFSSKAALKRHQDKHIRPYICHQPSCSNKSFGDKASFQRHQREVHGSETDAYICPIRSCKRHKSGFHRKYNLLEHQKRSHGPQSQLSVFSRTRLNISEDPSEQDIQDQQSEGGGEGSDTVEDELRGIMHGCEIANTEQSLRAKLHDLRAMRAEIDEDIASLERVLGIIGSASP